MKKFIKKHLYTFIYIVVAFSLLFFFVPQEESYYLEADIDSFKNGPYFIYMFYVLIGVALLTFSFLQIRKRNILDSLKSTLTVSAITILLGFSLSSVFSAFFLKINRTKTITTVTKEYEVMNRFLVELKTGKYIDYEELEPFLSRKQIEEFEKKKYINLKFNRGLLDIDFLEKK